MQIQIIFVVLLVICFTAIHSQRSDCDKIYNACVSCRRNRMNTTELNNLCRRTIRDRVWRDQTQCDLQLISCRNPCEKLSCRNIAAAARMPPRRP
ncbi:uncharacterized protein LOC6582991 [Drosophila mojavensis]|uniref:Uncharacterized protein n=1 Tax=Drosophila mojavensis TaxID=7230 RepID=B4L0H9_DROMO|nr:uncharacterized protein LOC6582991 [Drosophila mojavensis]EDW19148.1 uncharacterized protein Dmoj_GI11686 [Drosophila mojavensis]